MVAVLDDAEDHQQDEREDQAELERRRPGLASSVCEVSGDAAPNPPGQVTRKAHHFTSFTSLGPIPM
jgi:hypothetical protein